MAKLSKTKWAYAAAMQDGEGHFSITTCMVPNKQGKPYQHTDCKIGISNTSVPLMRWLKTNFGGDYRDGKQGVNHPCYRWDLDGYEKMEQYVLGVLPYLIIKREQAIVCLEFLRMRGVKNPKRRLELTRLCQSLNKGITPTTNTPNCPVNGQKIESELHGDMQSDPAVTQEQPTVIRHKVSTFGYN